MVKTVEPFLSHRLSACLAVLLCAAYAAHTAPILDLMPKGCVKELTAGFWQRAALLHGSHKTFWREPAACQTLAAGEQELLALWWLLTRPLWPTPAFSDILPLRAHMQAAKLLEDKQGSRLTSPRLKSAPQARRLSYLRCEASVPCSVAHLHQAPLELGPRPGRRSMERPA